MLFRVPAPGDNDAEDTDAAEDDAVPAAQQYTTPDRPTRSSLYSTPPHSSMPGSVPAASIAAHSGTMHKPQHIAVKL